MIERIKTALSIILILLLFPYVTVMLFGRAASLEIPTAHVPGLGTERGIEQETDQKELKALEQWVLEILPGQMPVTYELEALKAQAIIVRSNLVFYINKEEIQPEQLTEAWLREWGMKCYTLMELQEIWDKELFEGYYEKIHRAVEETCGKVLVYQGNYVDIPYHAVSAGQTRDGVLLGEGYSYLKAVECPGDLEAKNFLTVDELREEEMLQSDAALFSDREVSTEEKTSTESLLEIVSQDASGYVTKIRVGEKILAGEEFRHMFDLPSSCFTLQVQNDGYVITTKGLGHGFGLSMYQAQLKAAQGKNSFEILQYFYEELECISLP